MAGPTAGDAPAAQPTRNRKRPVLWISLGVAGLLVLCLGGITVLGAIVGPAKKPNPAAAPTTPAASHSSPSASAPASPTKSPQPSASKVAAKPDYAAAASVLAADDDHYRQEIAAGPPVLGTPAFTAWWQKAITDTQNVDDFRKADAYFTADNEPTDLLEAWRTDNGNAATDLYHFAAAEHEAGPGPATADMKKWQDAFNVDIAKADADVSALRAVH